MISVLAEYSNRMAGFPVKGPTIGLFADLEIRYVNGPIFVGAAVSDTPGNCRAFARTTNRKLLDAHADFR